MKILDVPHKSISDVKQSPMRIFEQANDTSNGVYIFNRNTVAGVMLTQKQYEGMHAEIELLRDKIDEMIIKKRLADENVKTYSVAEATGINLENIEFDSNDGWK